MNVADRAPVMERLQELEGWAEYITEALHIDKNGEPAKKAMLERVVGMPLLRQLRELSWSLRDRLHVVNVQLELSRPDPPTADPAKSTDFR